MSAADVIARSLASSGWPLWAEDCAHLAGQVLDALRAKRGMAFPADYVMLGNRREQVKMAGNAVVPPAARDLVSAVAESLEVA